MRRFSLPYVRRVRGLLVASIVVRAIGTIVATTTYYYRLDVAIAVHLLSFPLLVWGWWRPRPVLWILLITGITGTALQFVPPIELGGIAVVAPLNAIEAWIAFLGLREWGAGRAHAAALSSL
jgi:hypothetical protein